MNTLYMLVAHESGICISPGITKKTPWVMEQISNFTQEERIQEARRAIEAATQNPCVRDRIEILMDVHDYIAKLEGYIQSLQQTRTSSGVNNG